MEQEARRTKTIKETDRKCPNCGATLQYDPVKNGLSCAFCGHWEQIQTEKNEEGADRSADELDLLSETNTEGYDWGAKNKVIICKSCGAESIYDELQIADVCPYCGSNQVMQASEDVKTLTPGGVVPFRIDEKKAGSLFTNWIKGKFFCPKRAKESARPDAFKGVYLPYWTYDAKTTTRYTARYGIDREREGKDGKKETYTDWFTTGGVQNEQFDDVLVFGSKRYEADLMSRIEPFETAENVRYQPKFLQGFTAERYSIGLKDGWESAKKKMEEKIEEDIKSDISNRYNADHVEDVNGKTTYAETTYKYLLLPVWMSSFKYKDKLYRFLVNGQNGKVGGKTPVSAVRVILVIAAVVAVVAGLVLLMKACGR
ncbi:MAG: hypothetical protein IJK12_02050 [Clostridia bacterium]|nr:hypothetical protein [Clostridia bacterium]